MRQIGQAWREDASNRDLSRQRARIRERLVPFLERDFSPRAVDHLAGLAGLAREQELFWNALVEDRFRSLVRTGEGKCEVRVHDLLAPMDLLNASAAVAPPALRTLTERLIRRIYQELRGGLGAVHVEQVIRLASASASGRRAELPAGVSVERNFDDLIFSRGRSAGRAARRRQSDLQAGGYLYVVTLPPHGVATVSVPELKSRFCLKVIDWSVSERDTKRDSAVLDADLLRKPLVLRNWRPGDAYRPQGRRQTKKLKEMFLAGRVPGRDRISWPVLR